MVLRTAAGFVGLCGFCSRFEMPRPGAPGQAVVHVEFSRPSELGTCRGSSRGGRRLRTVSDIKGVLPKFAIPMRDNGIWQPVEKAIQAKDLKAFDRLRQTERASGGKNRRRVSSAGNEATIHPRCLPHCRDAPSHDLRQLRTRFRRALRGRLQANIDSRLSAQFPLQGVSGRPPRPDTRDRTGVPTLAHDSARPIAGRLVSWHLRLGGSTYSKRIGRWNLQQANRAQAGVKSPRRPMPH